MKDRNKKRSMVITLLLLTVFSGVIIKLFIIGSPVYANQLSCELYEDGTTAKLRVDTVESAVAFHSWKHNRYGNTIKITGRKVLVSPLFNSGHYETIIDIKEIDRIILGDKIIWIADTY